MSFVVHRTNEDVIGVSQVFSLFFLIIRSGKDGIRVLVVITGRIRVRSFLLFEVVIC